MTTTSYKAVIGCLLFGILYFLTASTALTQVTTETVSNYTHATAHAFARESVLTHYQAGWHLVGAFSTTTDTGLAQAQITLVFER